MRFSGRASVLRNSCLNHVMFSNCILERGPNLEKKRTIIFNVFNKLMPLLQVSMRFGSISHRRSVYADLRNCANAQLPMQLRTDKHVYSLPPVHRLKGVLLVLYGSFHVKLDRKYRFRTRSPSILMQIGTTTQCYDKGTHTHF